MRAVPDGSGAASAPLDNAGASARREYEKRRQQRARRIERRCGPLAGLVKFLFDDSQSTKAWAKGAEGERLLAEQLHRRLGQRAVVLHDRALPHSRANIDHVAVAASGVWVVDAKNYKGRVERRDVGELFRSDVRLYVGGRDKSELAEHLTRQVGAVRGAVGDPELPIHSAVCFVHADWKPFARPFRQGTVWVLSPRQLAKLITARGPLSGDDVAAVAARIDAALPPAVPLA
jgi:hypothetical protein